MMKKCFVLICLVMLAGCTYGQDYMENPESFLRDPHFSEYKSNLDHLESSYLRKEITYAEYIEKKDRLEKKYNKEVKERNDKIISEE